MTGRFLAQTLEFLKTVKPTDGEKFLMAINGSAGFLVMVTTKAQKPKPPACLTQGASYSGCLTETYFHTGSGTIIGAEAFHNPVRDGKGWDHPAMTVRH